jgi:hypothetical protein
MITKSEIETEYQDPAHQSLASSAYNIGMEWVSSQPVTWNLTSNNSKSDRRAARQKRRRQETLLWNHIYHAMVEDDNSTKSIGDNIQVVGLGFIALAILSGIISWVVRRILDSYFVVVGDIDD